MLALPADALSAAAFLFVNNTLAVRLAYLAFLLRGLRIIRINPSLEGVHP